MTIIIVIYIIIIVKHVVFCDDSSVNSRVFKMKKKRIIADDGNENMACRARLPWWGKGCQIFSGKFSNFYFKRIIKFLKLCSFNTIFLKLIINTVFFFLDIHSWAKFNVACIDNNTTITRYIYVYFSRMYISHRSCFSCLFWFHNDF